MGGRAYHSLCNVELTAKASASLLHPASPMLFWLKLHQHVRRRARHARAVRSGDDCSCRPGTAAAALPANPTRRCNATRATPPQQTHVSSRRGAPDANALASSLHPTAPTLFKLKLPPAAASRASERHPGAFRIEHRCTASQRAGLNSCPPTVTGTSWRKAARLTPMCAAKCWMPGPRPAPRNLPR